jgi:predicted nucleic acid-binding protein
MNAVDTNIFLYSIDRSEPTKQLKAQQLLQQLRSAPEPTFLLWQVLGELGQQLRRWRDQGKMTPAEFLQHAQAFRHPFPLSMPTPVVFDLALNLADRFSLAHWDSMILAACQAAGIAVLYTEDIGAPRTIDGIQLINPLV